MRIICLSLLVLLGCDRSASSANGPAAEPIQVFAAASLREAVTEIAKEWTKKSGQEVRLQCEATSILALQIKEGAPAAVFITAAPEWLDQVKTIERRDWLSNRLVLVVRKDVGEFDLKSARSLALANEQVPAGKYAKAALAHMGIKPPERTIYGNNVREVLSKVSQGGAEAGIVYATDAALDPGVRIVFTFPPESHPKILYSGGLLKPAGKAFFDALSESWAKEIARKHGFVILE